MKMKTKLRLTSILLCFVMLIGLLPTTALARTRDIIPVDSGNSLNMSVSDSGVLTWDAVPGATGYHVVLTQPNITELYHWDVTNTYLTLTTEMDGFKCDSGQYTLVVTAKGVSGYDDTMSYYYTSHVDKLESPNNLVWIGDKAAWDAVEGATSYNVSLYDFSGQVVTIPTTETLYDFSGSSPKDGWTFRVQALSNGTWSAKRYSDYTESPAKGSRTRTITPIDSDNALNMSVNDSGTLTWDEVPGATGYHVVLTQPNITELYHWDVTNTYLTLTTEMDGFKCDSGQYTLVVTAKGVSGYDDTMSYYYTSHVDKLESPNNLVWIGDKAAWDAVEGATSYNVSLYDFSGQVVTIPTTETLYDFSGSSPKDGWTFRVQALSNGTWSAERYSDYTESPAKDTPKAIYNIGAYVYDDTLGTGDSGGQVSLSTDKGTDGWSDSGYIKEATEGTTVTLNAEPAAGYEFVEWRQGTGGVTISTNANYSFTATEHKYLYAIFRQGTSGEGTENNPYVAPCYAELKALMANAPTDGTVCYIKLGGDITSEDVQNDYALTLTQENQNVVFDLAGYKITRNSTVTVDKGVIRAKEGTLTINDSVGTGGVYAKGKIESAVAMTSTDAVAVDDGIIIINGGTFESEYSIGEAVYHEAGKLYINGGTFRGAWALYAQTGRVTIYGGEFYTTEIDGTAISLADDNAHKVYNLTAYGQVTSNSAQGNLWEYIHTTGEVYIDNVKQAKTDTYKFVGEKVEVKTDMVDEIWITATTPVVGNSLTNSVDIPYGSDYEIVEEYGNQVIAWMKDGNPVNTETFEASTEYTLRIYVQVNAPTTMDICAKVNGQPAELDYQIESMEGYKFYWVDYTFPATENNIIPSASATITVPVAGETATAGYLYETENYNVSVSWQTSMLAEDFGNFNNQTFVAGTTYYAYVNLVAEDPYIFADGATIFVNGEPYTSEWTVGEAYKKYVAVYVPFTVPSADTYTVTFNANGGSGMIADETDQLGGYILPECGFTAPAEKQFLCWAEGGVNGNRYAVGEEYNVTGDVIFYAIWEDILVTEYIVSYSPTEGSGAMVGDVVEKNGTFTLEECAYIAPEGKQFKAWAIGSINGEQKQPGEQIIITGETYIYAIWEAVEYNVTVTGGTASVGAGTPITKATMGTIVTLTADAAPAGQEFDKWTVNGVVVADANNATTTFTMPAGEVSATATYRDIPAGHTCDIKLVEKVNPTCTTSGKNAYYKCDGCGKFYEDALGAKEIIDLAAWGNIEKLNHDFADATCTAPKTCKRTGCGVTEGVATGHSTTVKDQKSATYFATGYSGDTVCTVCDKVIQKGIATAMKTLKKPTVKVTAGKKQLKVKYTKVSGATGFQVQYKKGKKTVTKTYNTKKSATKAIKKLAKGTYKVKVRAMVKSGKKKAYSAWTKTYTAKVK